ncbi:MAG: hypothetical protein ACRCTQ_04125 [Brevinemataceae bacterium]
MGLYDQLPEKSFLKKLLFGIDTEFVEKFLKVKYDYEIETDKELKRLYRDKMVGVFWELYTHIVRTLTLEPGNAKRLFLRYGLTDLRYLSPEDQKFILERPMDMPDYDKETVFYADEWLLGILKGKIKASAVDETQSAQNNKFNIPSVNLSDKTDKFESLISVEKNRIEGFKVQRNQFMDRLTKVVELLSQENTDEASGISGVYTIEQNKALEELPTIHKELRRINKDISASAKAVAKAQESLNEIKRNLGDYSSESPSQQSTNSLVEEVKSLRQMAKMTVGRQGNMFPYLSSSFLPKDKRGFLFREYLTQRLTHWLSLDPQAFVRFYKNQELNISPYMILVPGYGQHGACWEPLDTNNKLFGRGRLCLPMFSNSPDLALLTAIGDIRWQVAKEVASYYWMEEGLTGRYYEYFLEAKLKGDLRLSFIKDYVIWMTKETQGIQKLEQSARYVFWRYVPLPDENKIMLSKKGYYYNQLWDKEQVWRQNPNLK